MTKRVLEDAIAAALTAKGSGPLGLSAMLELVRAGSEQSLAVSNIDATSDNGWTPRPDVMLSFSREEVASLGSTPSERAIAVHDLVADEYAKLGDEVEGVEFEVWFWSN